MGYPQAPWTLQGYAIQTMQLVDVDKARAYIPPELDIISVWPGKTLGSVYISSYQSSSVRQYNELIVVPAIVNYSGHLGGWVSHIYVDNLDSVAGGREIWGLPKQMADFTWREGQKSNVIVHQGNQQLYNLSYSRPNFGLPLPLSGTVLSALGADLLFFKGELESRLGLISSQLQIPPASPFASLNLGQPLLCVYYEDMRVVVDAPQVVGQKAVEFSYSGKL